MAFSIVPKISITQDNCANTLCKNLRKGVGLAGTNRCEAFAEQDWTARQVGKSVGKWPKISKKARRDRKGHTTPCDRQSICSAFLGGCANQEIARHIWQLGLKHIEPIV